MGLKTPTESTASQLIHNTEDTVASNIIFSQCLFCHVDSYRGEELPHSGYTESAWRSASVRKPVSPLLLWHMVAVKSHLLFSDLKRTENLNSSANPPCTQIPQLSVFYQSCHVPPRVPGCFRQSRCTVPGNHHTSPNGGHRWDFYLVFQAIAQFNFHTCPNRVKVSCFLSDPGFVSWNCC